jgi:hypothetical protein
MTLFIIAAISLAGGIASFFVSRSMGAKALDIGVTETSTAAALAELAASVAKEIGAGSFSQRCEVKGTAVALEPLSADFSGTSAVWYECTVTREWEEDYIETDKDGNSQSRTRRGSETVSSVKREPPFAVEDATGRTRVNPVGASIEPEKTWSSFEQGSGGGGGFRVGSFVFDALAFSTGGRRTLGYRFEERCIPAGRVVYVLGEASDEGGALSVRKPAKGRFLVSTRSEEAILAGAKKGASGFRIAAAVLAVVAVATLIAGFVTR